jgi:hypothetical protein
MPKYRILRGTYTVRTQTGLQTLRPGDVVDRPEQWAERYGSQLVERVGGFALPDKPEAASPRKAAEGGGAGKAEGGKVASSAAAAKPAPATKKED